MSSEGCVLLETKAFDAVSGSKDKLINDYNQITSDYNQVINTLLTNWEGEGADAFRADATKVKQNITHIQTILKDMCDTLTDCRAVITESDNAMGEYNKEPGGETE